MGLPRGSTSVRRTEGRTGGRAAAARRAGRTRRRRRDLIVLAVLVVAAIGIATALFVGRGGGDGPPPPAATAAPGPGPLGDLARRVPGDPLALGRVDAPVVMVMFSDYRCPFCAKFSRDTEQALVSQYVDRGDLRIEWRDYPIFGPDSTLGAQAGRAAAAQGRFWEFNHAVFAVAPERGHPDLPEQRLEQFATQARVPDLARFRADMTAPAAVGAVQSDLNEASSLGVPSTPAFVVNGNPIMGAQPIGEFRAEIDRALGRG